MPTPTMAYGREQTVAIVESDPQAADEETFPTFYCRALYNYQSTEGCSLSFVRGDIIEVLTQLESGWWDGLLGDERGWFPSNYVQRISDAEAELAAMYSPRAGEIRAPALMAIPDMHVSSSDRQHNWQQDDSDHSRPNAAANESGGNSTRPVGASNDFWLPQVDQGGQIFYVNTQTGERSRDLPAPIEVGDAHESRLDRLSSSASPSAGRTGAVSRFAGHDEGFASASCSVNAHRAGFGINNRSSTPEPWTKRLADDGLTYYYFNKITGQKQWTHPGGIEQSASTSTLQTSISETLAPSSRLRTYSTTSRTGKRDSLYSDDSDIHPRDLESKDAYLNGSFTPLDHSRSSLTDDSELTPAERLGLLLQASLTPPDAESIDELSDATRDAIIAVMASVDDNGLPKGANHDREVEYAVASAVTAIRNLLHVSCALSGPLPNASSSNHDDSISSTAVAQQLQAQLKTSQRKVTATLSKLVLSARAARFKRESLLPETMMRVEQDAADLQRAVDNFVTEVKKQYARTAVKQLHQRLGRKRLRGVFDIQHVGLGIPGSGSAASWKGFGFVSSDEGFMPKRVLNDETILEANALLQNLYESSGLLVASIQDMLQADELSSKMQTALASVSSFVIFMADINVRQEIDVVGFLDSQQDAVKDPYMQAVYSARTAQRSYEVVIQSLLDDGMMFLILLQSMPSSSNCIMGMNELDKASIVTGVYGSVKSLKSEAATAVDLLGQLLSIAREQIVQEARFRESMALQKSRNSMSENRPVSCLLNNSTDLRENEEDIVGMEDAMLKGGRAPMAAITGYNLHLCPDKDKQEELVTEQMSEDLDTTTERVESNSMSPASGRVPLEDDPEFLDEGEKAGQPRAAKIRQLLGDDAPERYIEIANADSKPWYLRSDYTKEGLILNPDGGIRAGTLLALIERLTTHEYGDPIFIRTFLMTYKSFTTTAELCELLIKRFWITPPEFLKPNELEEWTKLKQNVIRHRVLNTFKTMINDDQVLIEGDDLFILDRIREFLLDPVVSASPAAKYLLSTIDRKKQGGLKPPTVTPPSTFPPPPIIPKGMNKNRLKLLDIDPLELARQLTIMEFALYRKIKAIECLRRSRDQKAAEHKDHITDVIQMTNKIANWVNATILSKEDSRKRAALVKQFVAVADRCRNLHNFSSMAAIISGLNSPPIRRLKRTWEQVNGRYMTQLGSCEMTLDSTKNFTNYKATLAQTTAPCIPFIGVYLTTLTFVNDGSKDTLPGNLINFGKRQRAAEVIREIQHWQSKDFNLAALPPVLAFIEEALSAFNESMDWSDHFWNLSLEREPREREDEKMARLLQESGFL